MTTPSTEEKQEMARQFGHDAADIHPEIKAMNDAEEESTKKATEVAAEKAKEQVALADTEAATSQKNERWRKRLVNAIKKYMATENKALALSRLQKMLDAIEKATDIDEMNKIWMKSTIKIPLADDMISDDELEAMLSAEIDTLGEEGTPIVPLEGEEEIVIDEALPEEDLAPKSEIDQLIEDLQAQIDNEELALDKDAIKEIEETIAGLEETRAAIEVAKEVIEKNTPEVQVDVAEVNLEV